MGRKVKRPCGCLHYVQGKVSLTTVACLRICVHHEKRYSISALNGMYVHEFTARFELRHKRWVAYIQRRETEKAAFWAALEHEIKKENGNE